MPNRVINTEHVRNILRCIYMCFTEIIRILKVILYLYRHQWSDFSTIVLCSNFHIHVKTLAAAFWMSWSHLTDGLGKPANRVSHSRFEIWMLWVCLWLCCMCVGWAVYTNLQKRSEWVSGKCVYIYARDCNFEIEQRTTVDPPEH